MRYSGWTFGPRFVPVDGSRGIALMGLGIGRGCWRPVRLVQGLVRPYRAEMNGGPGTQGVALGYLGPPRWGFGKNPTINCCTRVPLIFPSHHSNWHHAGIICPVSPPNQQGFGKSIHGKPCTPRFYGYPPPPFPPQARIGSPVTPPTQRGFGKSIHGKPCTPRFYGYPPPTIPPQAWIGNPVTRRTQRGTRSTLPKPQRGGLR